MSKEYRKLLTKVFVPILMFIVISFASIKLISIFWPFAVAYIIALCVSPVVDTFESKCKIKPKYMSIILIILILGIISALIGYTCMTITANIPNFVNTIYSALDKLRNLDLPIDVTLDSFIDNISKYITSFVEQIAGLKGNSSIMSTVPAILFKAVITILSSYFLIADRKRIGRFIFSRTSSETKDKLQSIVEESKFLVNAYIVSQFKLMIGVILIITIGFIILKFNLSIMIPLIVVIGFLDFLPVVGSGTILIPWTIYCILTGDFKLAAGLAIIYIIITIFRQMASPKIIGGEVGISPFPSIVLMYTGFIIARWVGVILSIPFGMLFINLYKKHFFDTYINNVKDMITETKKFFT